MEILSLLGTLYSIAIFVVYIVLIGCASKLAVRLGRENGAWVFFSILFTPVLGIILLHCLGKTEQCLTVLYKNLSYLYCRILCFLSKNVYELIFY